MDCDVLIVGAGLSGLTTAYELVRGGTDCLVLEHRPIAGGRILSQPFADLNDSSAATSAAVDLGPSWCWPDQRHIRKLLTELQLADSVFPQWIDGHSVVEYADGRIDRSSRLASMEGSLRLEGGWQRLIDSLAATLPALCLRCDHRVQAINLLDDCIEASVLSEGEHRTVRCRQLVIAIPPRVVASTIRFTPAMTDSEQAQLQSIATWMAAQAKLVVKYATPFWREAGLSGDGFSQIGPLTEIHDASSQSGTSHALFGFVGVPADRRLAQETLIRNAAISQLIRMFGKNAEHPVAVHYKDWAWDEQTSTDLDRAQHQSPIHGQGQLTSAYDGRIIWAGSESAHDTNHSRGYLEGAVEAAGRAAKLVFNSLE